MNKKESSPEKGKQSLSPKSKEKKSINSITRRQSLKTMAAGAYAVPATMALLSANRAVAQSCPEPCQNYPFSITLNNEVPSDFVQIDYVTCTDNNTQTFWGFDDGTFTGSAQCGSTVTVQDTGGGNLRNYTIEPPPSENAFGWPDP